jgi:uncharacterized protein YuzE
MRIRYDREEDILMLELDPQGQIDHAEPIDSVIVHVTASGRPVLLEILDATEFLTRVVRAAMTSKEPA